jgi:putative ABC transport system permease protein
MALREAGRNRGSAAPAIAAVLGVVAGGMAFSLTVTADNVRNESMNERLLQQGAMTLTLNNQNDWDEVTMEQLPADWDAGYAEVEPLLAQHLDDLELTEIPIYKSTDECVDPADYTESELEEISCSWDLARPEENTCPFWEESRETVTEEEIAAAAARAREDARCDETPNESYTGLDAVPVSADPTVVAAFTQYSGDELDAAVAHLENGGVLVSDKWAVTAEGTAFFEERLWLPDSEEPRLTRLELPAMLVDEDLLGDAKVFLGPAASEEIGLVENDWERRYLVDTSTPVDEAVEETVGAALGQLVDETIWPKFTVVDYRDSESFYTMLAVAGLCALIALGSTAISTGLIIAEQRRDMTTLAAVGAAPGLRKRFAMWQTIVIALFGAALGTGAGLLGYALIREAMNRPLRVQYPFEVLYGWELPWPAFAIMLVAVPALAAAGALLFTRAKLPSEERRIT